jgi:hypothetical protein
MATPARGAQELEAKVDRTALIAHMSAALKMASDRWAEVCRIYDLAWKDAYGIHDGVLAKIQHVKKEREHRAADRLTLCLELAFVFLPVIGGKAAISLAPILSARGKLLANFVEREAQASGSQFATANPLVSQVVKEIGTRSVNQGKEAAAKIQNEVMEKLSPKYTKEKALAANTTPLDEFVNNTNETRGAVGSANWCRWLMRCFCIIPGSGRRRRKIRRRR